MTAPSAQCHPYCLWMYKLFHLEGKGVYYCLFMFATLIIVRMTERYMCGLLYASSVFKTFILSFFEWPLKTGFTVQSAIRQHVVQ